MKLKKLTDDEIQNAVTRAIEDAVNYVESEIAPARLRADKYFQGKNTVNYPEGTSGVIATKCRDTVRAIKPALMRVFLQSDKPVEFVASKADGVRAAEQATAYAHYLFQRNRGFEILLDVIHDALVKKVGIVKACFEEYGDPEVEEYTRLTLEEAAYIIEDEEVEILELEETEDGINLKIQRNDADGEIRFYTIAPEDFFVNSEACNVDDAACVGHSTDGVVGDLVAMGYDFDEVIKHAGDTETAEETDRVNYRDSDDDPLDPSMRPVKITEAYIRMDIDGRGKPQRHKFICVGEKYHVLDKEPHSRRPFAVFEVDPEPHTFFGRSLVEIIEQDQDAATSLLRGLINSINFMNTPRMEAVDGQVNMDDLMNNETGAIIRVKQPGMLREVTVGVAATAALPALEYYDRTIQAKTGVSGVGQGLDADAISGETATGVDAVTQAAMAQAELIARTLAEGGMRQLFEIILELLRAHPQRDDMMHIDGEYVAVDPRSWVARMDVVANVGLGTNRHAERAMALQMVMQDQNMIWQAYGPQNGLVTLTNIRNTRADILKLAGIQNSARYYQPMSPERERQMAQEAAAAAAQNPPPPDPNMAIVEIEKQKAAAKAQSDAFKAETDRQKAMTAAAQDAAKIRLGDDLARDKMAQDRVLQLLKLGSQEARAADAAIQREQAAPRP